MIFFQFLQAGGRWEEFLRERPFHYIGNRGSGALNVMGTVLLTVLSGHWRYAHINGLRGDCINPSLFGMNGVVCDVTMLEHEQHGPPYLFKLRHTAKVTELVTRMMRQGTLWQDCDDGWQALETILRLIGWTHERRVFLMRENPA